MIKLDSWLNLRHVGEPISTKLENYLGAYPNICLSCLSAAVRQLHKDEQPYGLDPIDV